MQILIHSPMLAIFVSIVGSMALYDKFKIFAFIIFVPLIFISVSLCSYNKDIKDNLKVFLISIIFAILCSLRIYYVISTPDKENRVIKNASGTITFVRQWGRFYVAILSSSEGKFLLNLPFATLTEGTRLNFSGITQNFKIPSDKNSFNESRYWKARGVKSKITLLESKELPEKFSISKMRYSISRFLSIYLPNLTGEYLKAAWLGERVDELNKSHIKWGTSHLLAVSGFHVGILILCLGFIFGRKNILLISIFLWLYIFLTGAAPSALRAGLMIQTGIFAHILGRPINGINTVSVAGVILLLDSPFLFWDIGYRLSVLSAMTLASFPRSFYLKKFSWFLISPSIFLVTFPQVTSTFGKVPIVGLFLNLFAPLFFSMAFSLASVGALLKFFKIPFSKIFLLSIEGIFIIWEDIANFFLKIIPFVLTWNNLISFFSIGLLIFALCRKIELSKIHSFIITLIGIFFVFKIF